MLIQFIVNSCRDRDHKVDSCIEKKFAAHDYNVRFTEYRGHAEEIAQDSVHRGIDALVAVGGDGTINEVVNGAYGSKIPIGIIPTGTANDLAYRLGIPENVAQACDIILSRKKRIIEAIKINNRIFLTTCGLGFPSSVIQSTYWLDKIRILPRSVRLIIHRKLYVWGALLAMMRAIPRHSASLSCDNDMYSFQVMSLIIGHSPILGKHYRIFPETNSGDNLLQLYVIKSGSRLLLFRHIMGALKGTHLKLPKAVYLMGHRFTFNVSPAAKIFGDGEIYDNTTRMDVQLIKHAVPFMVPYNGGCDHAC